MREMTRFAAAALAAAICCLPAFAAGSPSPTTAPGPRRNPYARESTAGGTAENAKPSGTVDGSVAPAPAKPAAPAAPAPAPAAKPAAKPSAAYVDKNEKYHDNDVVVSKIDRTGSAATVTKIRVKKMKKKGDGVQVKVAAGRDGKPVPITKFGDGKKGVFDSKKGRNVVGVRFASEKRVTVSSKAFRKSKVKRVVFACKTKLKKGAFSGTKEKNLSIRIETPKAKHFDAEKGAFEGLGKKAKIVVSKKTTSKIEFMKLKKKLVAAGFAGSIVRK